MSKRDERKAPECTCGAWHYERTENMVQHSPECERWSPTLAFTPDWVDELTNDDNRPTY